MKDSKKIKVKNNFFNLSVNYNKAVVATQLGILLGLIGLRMFAHSEAVRRLCVVIILLDVVILVVKFFIGFNVSSEPLSEENSKDGKEESKTVDVEVNDKPASKDNKKNKTVTKSQSTIKNKVAVPNPEASERAKAKDSEKFEKTQSVTEQHESVSAEPEVTPIEDADDIDLYDVFGL